MTPVPVHGYTADTAFPQISRESGTHPSVTKKRTGKIRHVDAGKGILHNKYNGLPDKRNIGPQYMQASFRDTCQESAPDHKRNSTHLFHPTSPGYRHLRCQTREGQDFHHDIADKKHANANGRQKNNQQISPFCPIRETAVFMEILPFHE